MMEKTFIIADAGVNHNGSLETAKKLVDAAVEAGADAVKFQTFKSEDHFGINAQKAEYQKETTDENETLMEIAKGLEINRQMHIELINYCKEKKIIFMSTPMDLTSVDLVKELGMEIYKIGSGNITNLPLLKKIGKLNKSVILSTGMSYLNEIADAIEVLNDAGTKKENITVLHCNTEYPTPIKDVNLKAMKSIQRAFNIKVGYSDHTMGIDVSVAAVAMGASVIEKHLTLSRAMQGPDHRASTEPQEFKEMVNNIRKIEVALGDGNKMPSPSEKKNISFFRKSITALTDIKKGDMFSEDNITVKRPGNGINPMKWDQVLGEKAVKDFKKDELIVTNI